ncbi:TetR/AcrR family transcriptional regulator [Streptosporangium sp. NPDC000396]|uniref:TetR/AcrR family transcriptional regulator n=1 Tax=Streptosporangium sp. NPDC000396 TaxID=3366185 RepID=UPI0036A3F95E
MGRRRQADRSEETTGELVEAATALFGRDGYAATSIDEVAQVAGVTKGAVYHHFDGKAGLFLAVFVRQQQRLAEILALAAKDQPDAWSAVREGCHTFLRVCMDPVVRQIVVLDGPAVLGWEQGRRIESEHVMALLSRGLVRAEQEGRIRPGDTRIRTHLIIGTLCEAAMLLARSTDVEEDLPVVVREVDALLAALSTGVS